MNVAISLYSVVHLFARTIFLDIAGMEYMGNKWYQWTTDGITDGQLMGSMDNRCDHQLWTTDRITVFSIVAGNVFCEVQPWHCEV